MSCALCPPNYMSPSFKVTSKRVLELPLVCHLSRPREGRRFPLFPGLLVTGLCCPQAGGAGGRGEGKTTGKQKPKVKEKTTGSQVSDETRLLAPPWAGGWAAASGSRLAGPTALRPGHLLLPHNRSKVPSGLRAAL